MLQGVVQRLLRDAIESLFQERRQLDGSLHRQVGLDPNAILDGIQPLAQSAC